ncbi:hypothetical protein AHF37_12069, partial [Paragonimus kellicotti]
GVFQYSYTLFSVSGNKTGNRRSANVRSVGYSDLFCLSKDDLWEALKEYPEAKAILMQRGEEILRKDNLIDEEVLRKAQENKETLEQSLERIDNCLNHVTTRLARLIGEYGASQAKLKRRLTRLEEHQYYMENQAMTTTDEQEPPDASRQFSEQIPTLSVNRQSQTNTNENDMVAKSLLIPTFIKPKRDSVITVTSGTDRRGSISSLDSSLTCATLPSTSSQPSDS